MTPRERIDAVLAGETPDRVPVTPIFMAWAAHHVGRTYRDYYLDHRAMTEAQIAVVEEFGFDQLSSISDPWREADDYGNELEYPPEGVGICRRPLFADGPNPDLLANVTLAERPRSRDRIEALKRLVAHSQGRHSILGWVEGPFAEYADLRGLEDALFDLYDQEDAYAACAGRLVQNAIRFAEAQVEAGATMIGMGDAAASLLSPEQYERFVLPFQQKQIEGIHAAGVPVKLHICGDTRALVPLMAQTGADVIDLDYMVPIADARRVVGPRQVLAGNFNPVVDLLDASPEHVRECVRRCAEEGGNAFIVQPGCEVPPRTPVENVRAMAL